LTIGVAERRKVSMEGNTSEDEKKLYAGSSAHCAEEEGNVAVAFVNDSVHVCN
jgi:hypothetical protein